MKINWISALMIATLSYFIEIINNGYIVLLVQWYCNLLSPHWVCPEMNSSLRLLVLCLFRPDLFVIHYCLFFKELIPFIGSLDKCHTSVLNALIFLRFVITWDCIVGVNRDVLFSELTTPVSDSMQLIRLKYISKFCDFFYLCLEKFKRWLAFERRS